MDGRIALAYAKRLYDLAEGPQGPQGEPGSGAVGTVAEAYSTSKTYAVGDYVIHDEEFYRCTTAITTAEAFNSAHWTKLVLTDEVSDLKSEKANKGTVGFNVWDEQYIVKGGNHIETKNYIEVLPSTDYYLKSPTNPGYGLRYYDSSLVLISSRYNSGLFTTPSNCKYIKFEISDAYGSVYNHDICLNISQPDTSISPHNGEYYPSNYLKNYADVLKNKLDISDLSAKETRDYGELSNEIDALGNAVLSYFEIAVDASANGWRLDESDGLCSSNSSYKLIKLKVKAGQTIKVESDDRFQFQTVASVPSTAPSNKVGQTYGAGTYILTVPSTATYLIMSSPVNDSNAMAYLASSNSDNEDSETEKYLNNARHIRSGAGKPLTLLHFSDIHADVSAMNRIILKSKGYADLIDDMICTGDIVSNTYASITSWWNEKIMTCIGNHDTASYSDGSYDWTALSTADRDAYYIAPFESNWGITHTSGTSYYYKDYADQKVRLIVMDGMLYNDNGAEATAQTSWLSNLLADAISNNLHVLIAIHAPHGGSTSVPCSFSRKESSTWPIYEDCDTPQVVVDTVATAIGNGLHFVGYIVGHTHQDNIWDADGESKQLMYCITCANVSYEGWWENSDQHRSDEEDAFNLVTIDTSNTLVKIIRGGGADIDDRMRTRKAICINYSDGNIIGEIL